MQEEEILVIEREHLLSCGGFLGIRRETQPYIEALESHCFAETRSRAERRTDLKQPIPYVLIMRDNLIFTTFRKPSGEEPRLHHKISVGIGGHMRPVADTDNFTDLAKMNLYRELTEELTFSPPMSRSAIERYLSFAGVLNDDRNEVGKCHFGLIYRLQLPRDVEVRVRETDKLQGEFRNPGEISLDGDTTETWSILCLRDHFRNERGRGKSDAQ